MAVTYNNFVKIYRGNFTLIRRAVLQHCPGFDVSIDENSSFINLIAPHTLSQTELSEMDTFISGVNAGLNAAINNQNGYLYLHNCCRQQIWEALEYNRDVTYEDMAGKQHKATLLNVDTVNDRHFTLTVLDWTGNAGKHLLELHFRSGGNIIC